MSGETKSITASVELAVAPDLAFEALIVPSAICAWWGAARAVVMPEAGGVWCAAWGDQEDRPDYITVATVTAFDPPRRLELGDYRYASNAGPLPFEADFRTEFVVAGAPGGCTLTVSQRGFPSGAAATEASEAFRKACVRGWDDSLDSLKAHLEGA